MLQPRQLIIQLETIPYPRPPQFLESSESTQNRLTVMREARTRGVDKSDGDWVGKRLEGVTLTLAL